MPDFTRVPEQDVVISSRVRLSRNFDDLPFAPKISEEYAAEVVERTAMAVFNGRMGADFTLLKMSDMEQDARSRLVEHHFISYDLLKYVSKSAAMVSAKGNATVMCNEEDHVRFQGLLPGLDLSRAAELAFLLEEDVGSKHPFAFDSQWGYLTASPANTGTGMRCSLILHLPALTQGGQMGAIMQAVGKVGRTIRGLYSEDSEARGHLYQLSNQATLGHSEEDIVRSLESAAAQIIGHERAMREMAEKKDMMALQDKLMRSWGELMYARLLTTKEFMQRYSDIRYAASMGYLHASLPALDCLMMDVQPGSLGVRAGKLIGDRESEILRAKVAREELKKLVTE